VSEVRADVRGVSHARAGASRRRARTVRVLVYIVSGLLSVWLVASAVIALINGLVHDTAVDPFTHERVVPSGDDP
jgi:predicted metal-binding membrane protein